MDLEPVTFHKIKTPYQPGMDILDVSYKQIGQPIGSGVIKTYNSQWISPVVVLVTRDVSVRFCVSYRSVNTMTVTE